MRGSVLGVGTDVAGSIRNPALCCGIYGFKPTANRVPYSGQRDAIRPGNEAVISCAGPLTTTIRDVEFFMKIVTSRSNRKYDCKALALDWRQLPGKSRLRIGILPDDETLPLHPPVARTLKEAARRLASAGHELVPLTLAPNYVQAAALLCQKLIGLDGRKYQLGLIHASGEPYINALKPRLEGFKALNHTLDDFYELKMKVDELSVSWNDLFVANDLDVVLGPASDSTAVPHDTHTVGVSFTMIWNVLNVSSSATNLVPLAYFLSQYPAIALPFLKADKSIDLDELAQSGSVKPCVYLHRHMKWISC